MNTDPKIPVIKNIDWDRERYTDGQLKKLQEFFRAEGMQLLIRHLESKLADKKMDYLQRDVSDGLQLKWEQGYIRGIEYLLDLPTQIKEELEDRDGEAGLQKDKNSV